MNLAKTKNGKLSNRDNRNVSNQKLPSFDDTFLKEADLDVLEREISGSKCKLRNSKDKFKPIRNYKIPQNVCDELNEIKPTTSKVLESLPRKTFSRTTTSSDRIFQSPDSGVDTLSTVDKDSSSFPFNNNSKSSTSKPATSDDLSQLSVDLLRDEVKHNRKIETVSKKRKSSETNDFLHNKLEIQDLPEAEQDDLFYFLLKDTQPTNEVLKNKQVLDNDPKAKHSVLQSIDSPSPANTNVTNTGIEHRMTQLLKSSQYRQEISQLFENLEHSICHFGSKDNQNDHVVNDSLVNDDLLSKFTLDSNTSIGDVIRNALKDNVNKSLLAKNYVNSTLLPSEAVFIQLGPFYGLPDKVWELIKTLKGIDALYDWQTECLNLPAIKQRKNLIYSLPTSGGKTLVAEILILREILCRKRNVVFVLPYVSIVQEKVWSLSSIAVELDFLVEEYAAGKGTYPPRKRRHKNSVYVATTEKALGLVNSLIEMGRLSELGLLVVDELHLIGDSQRGPTLETLLTKLMFTTDDVHIVGMSATIGNLADISCFLNADVYTRNFRPVELTEYVKCGRQIAKVNLNADEDNIFEVCRDVGFDYSEKLNFVDPDHIGGLVMETIPDGSCLVFCPTKKNCENVAKLLCKVIRSDLKCHKLNDKMQLLTALRNDAGTICDILKECVPLGVAYHHSGLTSEERKLIEEAYRRGILCVICCTSTLAAGVNLPAKRVIIRKPYIAQDFINLSRYKQMIGRAGRAGLGEVGESFLVCTKEEIPKVKLLFTAPMDETLSKLHEADYSRLTHLFLSCINLGTATTKGQLKTVVKKSLLAVQEKKLSVNIENILRKVIYDLVKSGAVHIDPTINLDSACNSSAYSITQPKSAQKKKAITIDSSTKLIVSKMGNAAMKGNLSLRESQRLYDDLTKAKDSLVLVNCLHLLYLVTPYNLVDVVKPEKSQFHYIMTQLGSEERKTANVLGINESCVVRLLSNQQIKGVPEHVLNRFYTSLMLYELWNEMSVIEVSEKYQVNRGIVQNLMTNAATFATNVVMFCEQLEELWAFVYLLKGMSQRLAHCCCKELLPLMELPAVKQARAKQLFQAGFKNLQSIAKADPEDLLQAVEFMSRKVANQLIAAAKMLLVEKVENLREEAEDVLDGIDGK
ncbi:hypothetical protein RN001_006971 [Aquatica leii]|uniref:Helicase POLQ-like n=1 Tax=Aquatica leii TaxID=1421715 RepID=A0AAN7SIW4_9COLE|nr:hypothetical protein RN001_006971 [Aquatica leii]